MSYSHQYEIDKFYNEYLNDVSKFMHKKLQAYDKNPIKLSYQNNFFHILEPSSEFQSDSEKNLNFDHNDINKNQNQQHKNIDLEIAFNYEKDNFVEDYYIQYKNLAVPKIQVKALDNKFHKNNSKLDNISVELLCFKFNNDDYKNSEISWIDLNQPTKQFMKNKQVQFKGIKINETSYTQQGKKFHLAILVYHQTQSNNKINFTIEKAYITPPIKVISRKKGRMERDNLSSFFDPFVSKYLENTQEQNESNDFESLYNYLFSQRIYNKSDTFFIELQQQIYESARKSDTEHQNQEQKYKLSEKPIFMCLNSHSNLISQEKINKIQNSLLKLQGHVLFFYTKMPANYEQQFNKLKHSDNFIDNYVKQYKYMINMNGKKVIECISQHQMNKISENDPTNHITKTTSKTSKSSQKLIKQNSKLYQIYQNNNLSQDSFTIDSLQQENTSDYELNQSFGTSENTGQIEMNYSQKKQAQFRVIQSLQEFETCQKKVKVHSSFGKLTSIDSMSKIPPLQLNHLETEKITPSFDKNHRKSSRGSEIIPLQDKLQMYEQNFGSGIFGHHHNAYHFHDQQFIQQLNFPQFNQIQLNFKPQLKNTQSSTTSNSNNNNINRNNNKNLQNNNKNDNNNNNKNTENSNIFTMNNSLNNINSSQYYFWPSSQVLPQLNMQLSSQMTQQSFQSFPKSQQQSLSKI
ncbi:hypothetical protein PPERSA_00663 [Pseudocohnilembus persalinus]|uniref:Uncharacterized protein n=1 Tax=Pseudocohnilembus persalinus TaxID=266149 RepID=A0A0V0QSS1_PSEPJ|nr:hypothetical protein PPERSA_00663 [Pseudocohnilembus persalinus]|eukprot:KRX05362.1 hypothetical protein PPERSA_00663 [Pseudocohnilembus persalinus]